MKTYICRSALRPVLLALEPRYLLSAGGNIDTSFGQNGYLNGYRAEALLGGSIVAQKYSTQSGGGSQVLVTPDGRNIAPYSGPIPQSPTNVQSDGKHLVLANGKLTRFNANGTIDTTFGQNGTVSNFGTNPNWTFTPGYNGLMVSGKQIYVAGDAHLANDRGHAPSLERLTPSGSLDPTFGDHGIAMLDPYFFANTFSFMKVGPDGEIYTVWDGVDDEPSIHRFSQTGVVDGGYSISENASFGFSVYGLQFDAAGKPLLLAAVEHDDIRLIRLNHDMTPDPTFGQGGSVRIHPPNAMDIARGPQGALLLRSDGEIIVSIGFLNFLPDFTVAFKGDFPAATASVSGRFFNDVNNNRKQDAGEPGLAYWQAYADLNNNGVFDAGEPSGFADGAGNYSIHGLKPGSYFIREVRQDGWTRTTPSGAWPLGYYKVTLKANQTITGRNFGNSNPNHAKGSISGTIFNDMNGDQLQDDGEAALAGWQAYVDMNDNGVFDAGEPTATSDKSGHYTISGLIQGGYVVREVRRDGWSRTTPPGDWPLGYYPVALAAGQKATGKNFGNVHASSALVSITGKVINDTNGNGKQDPGEAGKAGVEVDLINGIRDIGVSITTTAADGSFSFTNLPPGLYFLNFVDVSTGWTIEPSAFTLLPGQTFRQNFFDQISHP